MGRGLAVRMGQQRLLAGAGRFHRSERSGRTPAEDISPSLLRTTGIFDGKYYGLPYYTFTMGMFYRCDLFENEAEMAAFKEKYGYDLDIPTTYEQMGDIAEFFRRAPGETLKGEALAQDFYGVGLMASRDTNMQDELNSIVWTKGGDIILDDGSAGPREQIYKDAATFYVDKLLPNAPPAALSSSYDEVVSQLRQGQIAMTGPFFLDQWANAVKTETETPGSEICVAPSPGGGRAWVGAFGLGISNDSKNPDVAWDFLKFMTGPEAQRKFAEGGGTTTRLSILGDTEAAKANRATMGTSPPWCRFWTTPKNASTLTTSMSRRRARSMKSRRYGIQKPLPANCLRTRQWTAWQTASRRSVAASAKS